jgi:nicotinate-nucleotide adenylyltransferase
VTLPKLVMARLDPRFRGDATQQARVCAPIRTTWIHPPQPVPAGLRIGLLGGSFNPPHRGHIHASELALKQLKLDYVWWLVSPQNPLKEIRGMASFPKRLHAAQKFVRHSRIIVSDIEAQLRTQFTVDTLRALKRRLPQLHFVWLMGSDNLLQFPRWRNWQAIFALMPIGVVARAGSALAARNGKAATTFRAAYALPNHHFATLAPPAWTMLDWKRDPSSATSLRSASRHSNGD